MKKQKKNKIFIFVALVSFVACAAILSPRIFEEGIGIGDGSTTITKDGSGNMVFTDVVSGAQDLADLIGGGGVADHTLLTNIGDSTHPQLEAAIIANKTSTESNTTTIEDTITVNLLDTVALGDYVTLLTDTIPFFIFGGYSPTTSVALGVIPSVGKDTIYAIEIHEVVASSGAVNFAYNIYWNGYYTASGASALYSSNRTITSTTTGNTVTSLQNRKITPNNCLWAILTDATAAPDELYLELFVQKIPAYTGQ